MADFSYPAIRTPDKKATTSPNSHPGDKVKLIARNYHWQNEPHQRNKNGDKLTHKSLFLAIWSLALWFSNLSLHQNPLEAS